MACEFLCKYKSPVTCFHLDMHELQQNGVFYANVVGSTCATIVPVCYAKVAELLKNAWDVSKWLPYVLGDSSQQHIQVFLKIYDCK
jgi:hypothetical protein